MFIAYLKKKPEDLFDHLHDADQSGYHLYSRKYLY